MIKRTAGQSNNSQDGVTLLLAVLILAAITAIAFSLAAIITIEIRSSGDVLRTEPALYAVQAVTEEALFKYKREVTDADLDVAAGDAAGDNTGCEPASLDVCTTDGAATFNRVSLDPIPAARKFDPAPRVDVIAPGVTEHYLFIEPDRPQFFGHAYDSISITKLNSTIDGAAKFTNCHQDVTCATFPSYVLTQNDPVNFPIIDDGQYEMAVCNGQYDASGFCVSSTDTPLLVQIDAVRADNEHLIPLLDATLDITASYLGLTRKYTVQVPR